MGQGIVGLTIASGNQQGSSQTQQFLLLRKKTNRAYMRVDEIAGCCMLGFYCTADSLKAKLCRDGNFSWRQYCEENNLTLNQCGKLVVARNEEELNGLDELARRAEVNSVELKMISAADAAEIEPQAYTYGRALWVAHHSNGKP